MPEEMTELVYGVYDFGLSTEQEASAEALHRTSVVVDMTFQGPCSHDAWTDELRAELDERTPSPDDYAFGRFFLADKAAKGEFPAYRTLFDASGATAGFTPCRLEDKASLLDAAARLARMTAGLPWLRRVRRADDIRAAHEAGEHALWGMCQENLLRPGHLDLIDAAHELGVLHTADCAYNQMTFIGAGCTERYDPGLSHFGLEFVRRCNDVGVIVDTAHSGRQTTLDACAASRHPVIATHTSAAARYAHPRGKDDEEIRAIAETGGVVGVVTVPFFLAAPGQQTPSIEVTLDHIDHMVNLVGWRHVGIGTDWPLQPPHDVQRRILRTKLAEMGFRPEHNIDFAATLTGFRDYRDLVNITRGLVARGHPDEHVRGILGENFLRVLEQVNG
jgi:membrane dipeptidase